MSMMACILMISATFFTSCGDDGTNESPNPISELVFPKSDADNPIPAGQLVQIGGKDFADDCDIWLQGTGDSEVETEITVSAEGISFIAPNISGEYTVVLEQGGEVYTLGSLFFAEKRPSVFTGKRVTKISAPYGSNDYETYSYGQGNLIKFSDDTEDGGRRVFNLTYEGNQVNILASYEEYGTEEYLYTLNAEGYAVSAVITAVDDSEEYVMTQSFEYENGYLVKIVSKDDEVIITVQIKYANGNVTSYSKSKKDIGSEKPYSNYESGIYTYTEILNKGGLLPPDEDWLEAGDGYLPIAHYAGILGKPTTNLVKTNGGSRSYEYEMKDEYVEKCTVISNGTNREVFSYSFE